LEIWKFRDCMSDVMISDLILTPALSQERGSASAQNQKYKQFYRTKALLWGCFLFPVQRTIINY
jgi:hypothetical protein